MRQIVIAVLVAACFLVGAEARATGPSCTSDAGCSFSACYGTFAGTHHYYVCDCQTGADSDCVAGSDSNAGTSAASPKQSTSAITTLFSGLGVGDRIELCKGGFWNSGTTTIGTVNTSCSAANPCVIGSYVPPWASGNEGRPIITFAASTNGIFTGDGGQANHEEGYTVAGLEMRGDGTSTTTGTGYGIFIYNDTDDVMICDMMMRYWSIAIHLEGIATTPDPSDPLADYHNDRITFRNSTVRDCGGQGILGADNSFHIYNNYMQNNGFDRQILNHQIYMNANVAPDAAVNIEVVGNELYQNAIYYAGASKCGGAAMTGHGVIDGLLIQGNYVHEDVGTVDPGCWGIAIAPGYPTAESLAHVTITGNVVQNMGNLSIGLGTSQNSKIENNTIVNQQGVNAAAIDAPAIGAGSGDTADQAITVRNNSLYLDSGTGIDIDSEGTNHVVANNTIYIVGSGTQQCFSLPLSTASYSFVDYNDCYAPSASTFHWQGSASLASWQGSSGFDSHSITTNPLFTTARYSSTFAQGLADFLPQSGSPLKDAGNNTNAPGADINGVARPQNSVVDIGAFEILVVSSYTAGKGALSTFGGF